MKSRKWFSIITALAIILSLCVLGTVVSAAEESNNLLKADSKYWVWGSYNEDPEEYVNVQDDGSFFLRESGVAFVGEKVGNGQKISVKFSTNKDQWAAIQIRGNLTPEMAEIGRAHV